MFPQFSGIFGLGSIPGGSTCAAECFDERIEQMIDPS
jgi:hypothetical protein